MSASGLGNGMNDDDGGAKTAGLRAGTKRPPRYERRCTLAIEDKYSPHEVLLNLDLLGKEIRVGMLVAITSVREGGAEKVPGGYTGSLSATCSPSGNLGGSGGAAAAARDGVRNDAGPAHLDGTGRTYVFLVKEMPRDVMMRMPTTEVLVVKHIADAFGFKRGVPVTLMVVSCVFTRITNL